MEGAAAQFRGYANVQSVYNDVPILSYSQEVRNRDMA
jgi:hypothetical protein